MEIKTKFDVDQEIYFMERNEVTKETIIEININVILEYYM
jgi:hypothetical protein